MDIDDRRAGWFLGLKAFFYAFGNQRTRSLVIGILIGIFLSVCVMLTFSSMTQPDLPSLMQSKFAYENCLQPPRSDIDRIKGRYAIIPKALLDFDSMASRFVKEWEELSGFMDECVSKAGFVLNNMVPYGDYCVAYAMMRKYKPTRVIEVGSGYSTRAIHSALKANAVDGATPATQICIEPFRADVIAKDIRLDLTIIPTILQDVPAAEFNELGSGDVFYIDSSHVTQPFGDTILELAFILPQLADGVIVHLHDITLPYNYPDEWLYSRTYTEQYLLALLLYGNQRWEVLLNNNYLGKHYPEVVNRWPEMKGIGSGFWIRKLPVQA